MIEKPSDGNWLAWVNKSYPFDSEWERHLLTRTERPKPGTAEQLNDLRGIADRSLAANLAELWFYAVEHQDQIEREQRADRERQRESERKRLAQLAKLALDCKLGETRDEREAAQGTANQFLGNAAPEHCDYDQLHDWELMHRYARALARGEHAKRPMLSRDRRREAQQRKQLDDINASIDAAPAGRPRHEQQGLGGWQ